MTIPAAHQIQRPAEPTPAVRDLERRGLERCYVMYGGCLMDGGKTCASTSTRESQGAVQVYTYMETQWPDQMWKTEPEDKRGASS